MFFLRIQCLDGWCFSLWGGESSLRFSKAFFKGKPQFRVVFVQTDLSVPVSKMFFVQGLQKNIEILLQEWPMLVEWTHHLSSFEVSALEGGDACFTEMLKARISIVHLGILWGVRGGGANVSTEDPKKLQLQASERRRCFFSTILGDSNETTWQMIPYNLYIVHFVHA